jgi:SAM-dependent methyltransferase
VFPGLVDADLLNEHVSRYRFAARFTAGRCLDVGCGAGYGTTGVGIDLSLEAVAWARRNYPAARFLQASAASLPFADGTFDLVTAFEVIEHLESWSELLTEADRVLKPRGVLLVSTPNKTCYAEMRARSGPNPFHVHEFEFAEFEAALYGIFPHVRMWAQNHAAAIVFAPLNPGTAKLEAHGDPRPDNAQFFVAACSRAPIDYGDLYAWMPSTANVLRERERHIARLEGELAQKDEWLTVLKRDHAALQRAHDATLAEAEERSLWAMRADRELEERDARIAELQREAAERLTWVGNLEARIAAGNDLIAQALSEVERLNADLDVRAEWARSLERQLEVRTEHVAIQQREIEENKASITALKEEIATVRQLVSEAERVALATQELADATQRRLSALEAERALIARSKWIRLGRSLKLGPVVNE